MAFDEGLDTRVGDIATAWGAVRKPMFGGTGYLVNGNMFAGIHKDSLVLRLSPGDGDAALTEPGVRPFDITGRPMKGWVMAESESVTDDNLLRWLALARGFVETLPAK
ncbi:MAG: TfoX family protein [Actinobacteria bacterium]|nr:TfoX family protein [Actinomycetota bacterium]